MTPDLQQLFNNTQKAFETSDIKKYAAMHKYEWYYSLAATRLATSTTAIVGFNWGVEKNKNYTPQTELQQESFKDAFDKKWLGSFQRVYTTLLKYLPANEVDEAVQTNFCFFRSAKEAEITAHDLELTTPLFHHLISIIKPKRIIAFSNRLSTYCLSNGLCSNVLQTKISSGKKTLFVTKGTFNLQSPISIFFLPHPNARVKAEARKAAWDFCFNNSE